MIRHPLRTAKECTTCDICGNRLVVPPGVYYRGMRMHKSEAMRMGWRDWGDEVKSPKLAEIEQSLQIVLTKPSGG